MELKRASVDVISIAAGEPDFDTSQHVKVVGKTKYIPSFGVPKLREAIAAKFLRENKLEQIESALF